MTHSGEDALVGGGGGGFCMFERGTNRCGECVCRGVSVWCVFVVDGYRVSEGLMRVGKGVQLVGVGGKGLVGWVCRGGVEV